MKLLGISSLLVLGTLLQHGGAASLPEIEVLTAAKNSSEGLPLTKSLIQPRAITRHIVTKSGTRVSSSALGGPAQQDRVELRRTSLDICQVRLDFDTFELAKPDWQGNCYDKLMITGATNLQRFETCGSNRGQHLYLHYGDSMTIVANVIMYQADSHFTLKATFFNCSELPDDDFEGVVGAPELAPSGCTQYYTDYTAEVKSFNYVKTSPYTSQQINNEKYTVCVKDHSDMTSIKWEQCGEFHISDPQNPGFWSPDQCTGDYIDVPGSEYGRYCGYALPSQEITTIAKPFTLWVNFNEQEETYPNFDPSYPPPGFECAYDPWGYITCSFNPSLGYPFPETDYYNTGFCLKYTVQ